MEYMCIRISNNIRICNKYSAFFFFFEPFTTEYLLGDTDLRTSSKNYLQYSIRSSFMLTKKKKKTYSFLLLND